MHPIHGPRTGRIQIKGLYSIMVALGQSVRTLMKTLLLNADLFAKCIWWGGYWDISHTITSPMGWSCYQNE